MPVVSIIRQRQVLRRFPGLTEADLYLWIMDHRYYLALEYGSDVGAETATQDFTGRFGRRSLKQWLASTLKTWEGRVRSLLEPTNSSHDPKGAQNDRAR